MYEPKKTNKEIIEEAFMSLVQNEKITMSQFLTFQRIKGSLSDDITPLEQSILELIIEKDIENQTVLESFMDLITYGVSIVPHNKIKEND